MPLFTDNYLQQLLDEAEKEISTVVRCIIVRTALAVTAGTAQYTLSSDNLGILRITHKGDKVWPSEHADFDWSQFSKPQAQSNQGKPVWYLRLGYGYDQILFHPVPSETISAVATTDGSDIESGVIVTSIRAADPTSSSQRLLSYLRRNITKYYVMSRAYAREGKTQNLQASQYFKEKYDNFLNIYKGIMGSIPKAITIELGPRSDVVRGPARPSLPTTGVWSF